MISFIVAIDRHLLIGDEKGIPWHLPADLKRFRKLTFGKPIIMGRTTFEHIGRPLDQRPNIVLTRRTDYQPEGILVAHSMAEALALAGEASEIMVIGGGEVFRAAAPLVERIYLTIVEGDFTGNAYYPQELPTHADHEWREVMRETHPAEAKNPHPHQYVVLERILPHS